VLLLYLPQKERWVVRPLSDPCDGFLSLKATNLSLKPRNSIMLMGKSVHQYFVVQRLDYLCEVKEWGAVEIMHNQALEMAAELRAKWLYGASNIYANLALHSEMLGNTQKTIDFLAQELAIAEEALAKKDMPHVPATLYCKLGESALDWSLMTLSISISESWNSNLVSSIDPMIELTTESVHVLFGKLKPRCFTCNVYFGFYNYK
jgi:hypothetical protein